MSEKPITILIPAPLRRFTGGESKVPGSGATVAELLDSLEMSLSGYQGTDCRR